MADTPLLNDQRMAVLQAIYNYLCEHGVADVHPDQPAYTSRERLRHRKYSEIL